jgi:hypothetical protein
MTRTTSDAALALALAPSALVDHLMELVLSESSGAVLGKWVADLRGSLGLFLVTLRGHPRRPPDVLSALPKDLFGLFVGGPSLSQKRINDRSDCASPPR